MKRVFIPYIIAVVLLIAAISYSHTSKKYGNQMLTDNIESLSAQQESGGSFVIFRVCSKNPGSDYCSFKRGNRKWAMDIGLNFNTISGDVSCPNCPDNDFDYED